MKIIIIGGSAAGMSAAAKANRVDPSLDIAVYEKSRYISFGACGLPYFAGGFFKDATMMLAKTVEDMEKVGVRVKTLHEVKAVDAGNKIVTVKNLQTGEEFTDAYDKLMIATGAVGKTPVIPGMDLGNIFALRSMGDGLAINSLLLAEDIKDIVIIGAGPIGIEAVHAARHLGKHVTLIMKQDRILSRYFSGEIILLLEEELRKHSVTVRLGEEALEITGTADAKRVVTDKGSYRADLIIHSIGSSPNTAFLENTGIEMEKGMILVDRHGQTSVDDVYAAGDCASIYNVVKDGHSYSPLATVANKLGRIVGENMAGGNIRFMGSLDSMCIQVMDMEAGRTGITETQANSMRLKYATAFIHDTNQSGYYPGQEDIFIKLIYDAESKVILGGEIAGKKGAVLRVNTLAACIYNKMTTGELAQLDLCYAPPFSKAWDALNIAGSVAK
ncbi:MAG: CoA-disulfide reductase [Oscillospiraceae bacterium]|nr:CoA-disulfide reductase [Oscillospiraceae bacterium]